MCRASVGHLRAVVGDKSNGAGDPRPVRLVPRTVRDQRSEAGVLMISVQLVVAVSMVWVVWRK